MFNTSKMSRRSLPLFDRSWRRSTPPGQATWIQCVQVRPLPASLRRCYRCRAALIATGPFVQQRSTSSGAVN